MVSQDPGTTGASTCNWIPRGNYDQGKERIWQHGQAVGKGIGKPIILEEYGALFPGIHTSSTNTGTILYCRAI